MSTPRHDTTAGGSLEPGDQPERPRSPDRPTQILGGVIVTGVVVQSALAGGFLAGRPALRDVHEYLGYGLLATAVTLLAVGLLSRRRRLATPIRLPTRTALVLALAVTVFVGMRASRGSSDLLMLHIPLAFAILTLAARLVVQGATSRAGARERARTARARNRDPAVLHR